MFGLQLLNKLHNYCYNIIKNAIMAVIEIIKKVKGIFNDQVNKISENPVARRISKRWTIKKNTREPDAVVYRTPKVEPKPPQRRRTANALSIYDEIVKEETASLNKTYYSECSMRSSASDSLPFVGKELTTADSFLMEKSLSDTSRLEISD